MRNVAEQVSVLEQTRTIDAHTIQHYLPHTGSNLPAVISTSKSESDFSSEREILYKVLFDMKADLNDLKKLTMELMKNGSATDVQKDNERLIEKIYGDEKEDNFEVSIEDLEVLAIPEKTSF